MLEPFEAIWKAIHHSRSAEGADEMLVLITYDVATKTDSGRRRLRKIARACQDWGTRVQFSVFECELTHAQWVELRHRILELMNPEEDSVRFYPLDEGLRRRIEHHGVREPVDLQGPLIV